MSELIPLGSWVDHSVHYLLDHDSNTFDAIGRAIESLAALVEHGLQAIPMWALMAIFIGVGLWRVGWRFALFTTLSLLLIYATGFWDQTVVTLGLTLSSTIISLVIGIPLGIWTAKSKHVALVVRPILDLMQTMPAFVYLIPMVALFGVGNVAGVSASLLYALPAAVRATTLGLRAVPRDVLEAGQAFGSTHRQLLLKVELPIARPYLMLAVNQTILLVMAEVVVAGLVGAGGLGLDVVTGFSRSEVGLGAAAGLAMVLMGVVLDRLSQSNNRQHQTMGA